MKIRPLLASLIMGVSSAYALQPPNVPGLLPTEIARPLLEQDPRVAAARAGLEVARQEASILDKSPYEWTAKALGQRRSLDTGPRYREWNVGIERTIRLPGKGSADRNIGKATIDESKAQYGEALHESARELVSLWLDWLAAERGRELAASNLVAVQENLKAVDKRTRAGDASRLDLNFANAELAEQKRMDNDARTQASAAWARLSARFPGINRQSVLMPSPLLITEDETLWRDRIIAENDELKVAQTQLRIAQAQADRARADRFPIRPSVFSLPLRWVAGNEFLASPSAFLCPAACAIHAVPRLWRLLKLPVMPLTSRNVSSKPRLLLRWSLPGEPMRACRLPTRALSLCRKTPSWCNARIRLAKEICRLCCWHVDRSPLR